MPRLTINDAFLRMLTFHFWPMASVCFWGAQALEADIPTDALPAASDPKHAFRRWTQYGPSTPESCRSRYEEGANC
jgi:hypothetical protein